LRGAELTDPTSARRPAFKGLEAERLRQLPSLRKRACRLQAQMLAASPDPAAPLQEFIEGLPRLGASARMLQAAQALTESALAGRGILWLIDESTLDAGLAPAIVPIVQRGLARTVAMTGAAATRDYEMATLGRAGEDVAKGVRDGLLGLNRETGETMNAIINEGVRRGFGLGDCMARGVWDRKPSFCRHSILAACARRGVPVAVLVDIGADGFHRHPNADGAVLGKGSLKDMHLLAGRMKELHDGGSVVALHSGAALEASFVHALAHGRGEGEPIEGFTIARFGAARASEIDLPGVKEVFDLTGPIEVMLPLFVATAFSMVE
jgi:hypothetical protein